MIASPTILYHKFTEAGLGQAPFRFIGCTENRFQMADGTTKPGGSCDYCYTGILYEFWIMSADGKRSKVGCECIRKAKDHKLLRVSELAKRKILQEKRAYAREAERQAELERQRAHNGGLTNWELARKLEKEQMAEREAIGRERGFRYKDIIARLRDGKGGFRDSIADQLAMGRLPVGRGLDITIDILARQEGRRGSKKYDAEVDRLEALFQ